MLFIADVMKAAAACCPWLEAQKRLYKREYPKRHLANWLRQRKWENFATRPSASDNREVFRAMWNGAAARLLGAICTPSFQGYFCDAEFDPGPPVRITVASPFKLSQIERNSLSRLHAVFGRDVEVAAK